MRESQVITDTEVYQNARIAIFLRVIVELADIYIYIRVQMQKPLSAI